MILNASFCMNNLQVLLGMYVLIELQICSDMSINRTPDMLSEQEHKQRE